MSEINQRGHMAGLRSGTVSDVWLLYFREEDQLCKTTITNINNNSVCVEQKANLQSIHSLPSTENLANGSGHFPLNRGRSKITK